MADDIDKQKNVEHYSARLPHDLLRWLLSMVLLLIGLKLWGSLGQ